MNKKRSAINFFGIGPKSNDELKSMSDKEFINLLNLFEYYYNRALDDYNSYIEDGKSNQFAIDNINMKVKIMIDQSLQLENEKFRRLSLKYGWTKRKNQYS
jgi:hypothetical protein